MNEDSIFLLRGDTLSILEQHPYKSEAVLQEALASFPEVIAGPTTVGDTPPGLLLIRREMGVPSKGGGAASFSLDHLFIDANAVPILVEVKRSSDTRIRREVVGQMLDYVANAVTYWPVAGLREALAKTAEKAGSPSPAELVSALAPDLDVEEFWRRVEENLRGGRVRLLFVADVLPPELVRVIEFLNEQMNPAEVLGVELRQYRQGSDGQDRVLVPRVVGRTSTAVSAKVRSSGGKLWTRDSLLETAVERCSTGEVALIEALLDDAEARGVKLQWGTGQSAGVCGWYMVGGQPTGLWIIQTGSDAPGSPPRFELHLGRVAKRLAAAGEGLSRIEKAADRLREIPSTHGRLDTAQAAGWLKYPQFPLKELLEAPAANKIVLDAVRLLADPSTATGAEDILKA